MTNIIDLGMFVFVSGATGHLCDPSEYVEYIVFVLYIYIYERTAASGARRVGTLRNAKVDK